MTLADSLARRRAAGRCGFVPFLTAGDPSMRATEAFAKELAARGADLIELGVPFSDPVADGPTIQAAGERALRRGATLKKVLAAARRLARAGSPPIILFTYLNPALAMGRDAFAKACGESGVRGVLVVDLPAEEWGPWADALSARGVEPVLLASPTTSRARLDLIGRLSGSLVYYASREGVTGARRDLPAGLARRLAEVRRLAGKPLIVGFGVAGGAQARALAAHCDGVVVGSALVAAAARGKTEEAGRRLLGRLAREVVGGLSL